MPRTFLTKDQQRKYLLKIAINEYLLKTGETKESLIRQMGMSTSKFYSRLRKPETFQLGELWVLFDIIGTPLEQRAKLME